VREYALATEDSSIPLRRRAARSDAVPGLADPSASDECSVREFFERGELLSQPPPSALEEVDEADTKAALYLDPRAAARRSTLRKMVAGVMVVLGLFAVGVVSVILEQAADEAGASSSAVEVISDPVVTTTPPDRLDLPPDGIPIPEQVPTTPAQPPPRQALGVALPPSKIPGVDMRWDELSAALEDDDFKRADQAVGPLCRHRHAAIRDRARLIRALLWARNGKRQAVQPVFEDLAKNAKTEVVRRQAREVLDQPGSRAEAG